MVVPPTLALLTILLVLTGCASTAVSTQPTPTCEMELRCQIIVPPCGPSVSRETDTFGLWYHGRLVPKNITQLAGFQPALPVSIPFGLSWYKMLLVGSNAQSPNQAPLLHAGYGAWPPQSRPGGATANDMYSVLILDETTGPLDPLSNLIGFSQQFRVTDQHTTTVNREPAILAHLSNALNASDRSSVTELLWHQGPLSLRMLGVVSGGAYVYLPNSQGASDIVLPWSTIPGGAYVNSIDPLLPQSASSMALYTGCGN